jgi:uncharacterized protein YycO
MEEEMLKEPSVVYELSGVLQKLIDHLVGGMVSAYERKHPGEKPSYGGEGNDLDLSVLELGDVISIHPVNPPELAGILGPFIQLYLGYVSGAHWYHTAVYAGEGKIIEVRPPKVRKVDAEILHTATDTAVYRVKTTDEIKRKAVKFCESKVGLLYYYGWMFVFPLLYPSQMRRIETDRYNRSGIAWASYKSAGVDLDGHPGFNVRPPISGWEIAPQDIADSDNVELIASAGKR